MADLQGYNINSIIGTNKVKPAVFLLLMFLLTRITLVVVGVASIAYLPMITGEEYRHIDTGPVLDMWYRWDAGFYTSIALYGYQWATFHKPSADMAFLPVYPLSIRGLNYIFGCSQISCTLVSGLLVSNIALLVSVYLLFQIVENYGGSATAYRSVGLLLLSPISVFFSGCYTEALFLCLSLLVFQALQKERFGTAVLVASLACLTRLVGLSLYLPLLLYSWRQPGRLRITRLLLSHVPLIVFVVYIAYMGLVTGNVLAYFNANSQIWERSVISKPWEVFTVYFSGENVSLWGWKLSWIDWFSALFYLFLAVVTLTRNLGAGVFALPAILIPIFSGTLVSMPRYGAVLFPFYWVVAEWANQRWKQVLVYSVSFLLLILFTARFTTWHWIA